MTNSLFVQLIKSRTTRLLAGVLLSLGCAVHAMAAPVARAGRIVEFAGSVRYFDDITREWRPVVRNQTVAQGEYLHTDERSRMTIRMGSISLWLDERSDLEFKQLDDDQFLIQLSRGSLVLQLRSPELASQTRVLTREGQVVAESAGLYRVDQYEQTTRVLALQGRLRFESNRSAGVQRAWMREGEQMEFGGRDGPSPQQQTPIPDSFSDWVGAQILADGRFPSGSMQYVSPEMTGAEELDRYGRWEQTSDYGALWTPHQMATDWAPYRQGRWLWTTQWGWSWVDDAPWGFAPFHYGRWVQWRGRWGWAPGNYVSRPVYIPAHPHAPGYGDRRVPLNQPHGTDARKDYPSSGTEPRWNRPNEHSGDQDRRGEHPSTLTRKLMEQSQGVAPPVVPAMQHPEAPRLNAGDDRHLQPRPEERRNNEPRAERPTERQVDRTVSRPEPVQPPVERSQVRATQQANQIPGGGVQDKRVPPNAAVEEPDRDKRNRRTKEQER